MQNTYTHPLDRLINNNSLFMLEALIPFVDSNMKKILVVYIKMQELSMLMNSINDPTLLKKEGFDLKISSSDELIDKLCDFMPDEISKNIKQTIQMINMMKMMEQVKDVSNVVNNDNSTHESKNAKSDLFSNVMDILNDYDNKTGNSFNNN